jgi:hypothetical protein
MKQAFLKRILSSALTNLPRPMLFLTQEAFYD